MKHSKRTDFSSGCWGLIWQLGIEVIQIYMAGTKLDVDKFTGANDFNLWRLKMKAFLVHQGLSDSLSRGRLVVLKNPDAPRTRGMLMKDHSTIFLSLGDDVLREVAEEDTAIGLWEKLTQLYLRKSLAN